MTTKLIITSLTGVGIIGGVTSGCYYFCGSKNSKTVISKDQKVTTNQNNEVSASSTTTQAVASSSLPETTRSESPQTSSNA